MLSLAAETPERDPLLELAYDEGGRGWWPIITLVFEQA